MKLLTGTSETYEGKEAKVLEMLRKKRTKTPKGTTQNAAFIATTREEIYRSSIRNKSLIPSFGLYNPKFTACEKEPRTMKQYRNEGRNKGLALESKRRKEEDFEKRTALCRRINRSLLKSTDSVCDSQRNVAEKVAAKYHKARSATASQNVRMSQDPDELTRGTSYKLITGPQFKELIKSECASPAQLSPPISGTRCTTVPFQFYSSREQR